MANNLTSRLKEVDKRVEALENQGFSNAESLAKIELLDYGDVVVDIQVNESKHYNKMTGTFHAGVFNV